MSYVRCIKAMTHTFCQGCLSGINMSGTMISRAILPQNRWEGPRSKSHLHSQVSLSPQSRFIRFRQLR